MISNDIGIRDILKWCSRTFQVYMRNLFIEKILAAADYGCMQSGKVSRFSVHLCRSSISVSGKGY